MNTSKRYVATKITTLMLCATMFVGGLTACSQNTHTDFEASHNTTHSTQSDNQSSSNHNNKILSLAEIKPTFSDTTWHGEKYVKIDEESLLQIIRVAMNDAEKMYKSIGGFNMKLNPDTHEPTNTFYPDWMNEYFFLSRARRESVYMINYIGEPVDDEGNRAMGTMQIVPEYLVPTLNQYMRDKYKCNITFDDYNLIPSERDIYNYKTSSEAREHLKQAVYNSVYLSICNDIYNAKCTGPNHKDYYEKTGGFEESMRQKIVTALYLFRREDVISSLKTGTFNDKFGNSQYVKDILSYQQESKNNYENGIEFGN